MGAHPPRHPFLPYLLRCSMAMTMALLLFIPYSVSAGEIEFAKVVDISGHAEVLGPFENKWKPAAAHMLLEKGSKVRTLSESSVQILFDRNLGSIAKLAEKSRLDVLGRSSDTFFLERGGLFLYREGETGRLEKPQKIRIRTKDGEVQIGLGGCVVQSTKEGTFVRVFDERVEVTGRPGSRVAQTEAPRVVEEGFKFFTSVHAARSAFQRMQFADYGDWQKWIKSVYEKKDDFEAEALEKVF